MSHKYPSSRSELGFTLIEATISMTLLLIVLLMSMTFLISMRTFSQRQEMFAQPRQSARRAMDYISYYIRGATDMNDAARSPNALVCYYQSAGASRQATYNNIADAKFGDIDTDMISLAAPTWDATAAFPTWFAPANGNTALVSFTAGCGTGGDTVANLNLFKNLTGAHTEGGVPVSNLLSAADDTGAWTYYKITQYGASTCTGATPGIGIISNPSTPITPPGGAPGLTNPNLNFAQYASFRVKNAQLQQKTNLFDPSNATANEAAEDAAFSTLLDNIEDLQIAYVYNDGNVYNANAAAWSAANQGGRMGTTNPAGTAVTDIPTQAGPLGAEDAFDSTNVIGLRVSVVARSGQLGAYQSATKNVYFRPASEDRAQGASDRSFHYRLTSTILLRNRALGN
jgi:Tfp pilus assembly protein PilW